MESPIPTSPSTVTSPATSSTSSSSTTSSSILPALWLSWPGKNIADILLVYGSALALAFFLISSNILAWSVFKMNVHVNFKMRSYCERECTHWASVGFLSSLLYFGLGCERHSSKFCENLAAVDWCFQFLCFNLKNFPKVRSEASLPFIIKVIVPNRGQGQK